MTVPTEVATIVVEQFMRAHALDCTKLVQDDLVVRIQTAMRIAVTEERNACAALCRDRINLWHDYKVGDRQSNEARGRENEAVYLEDAILARNAADSPQ